MEPPIGRTASIPEAESGDTFRDHHEQPLLAFAMLLTLGDTYHAWALVEGALSDAEDRKLERSDPGRTAAWLRGRVTMGAARIGASFQHGSQPATAEQRDVFREMGVTRAVAAGLSALTVQERAAFIASAIEGMNDQDVAAASVIEPQQLVSALPNIRRIYALSFATATDDTQPPPGPLRARIDHITDHAAT